MSASEPLEPPAAAAAAVFADTPPPRTAPAPLLDPPAQLSLTTLGFLRGMMSQQSLPIARDDFEETALIAATAKRELQAAIDAAEAREAASAAVEPTAGV